MEAVAAPALAFKITYNGKNVTADLAPYVEEISHTDRLSGQADELELVLSNADGRWQKSWYPTKGAELSLEYGYSHLPLVSAGSFEVDEVELAGPPDTVRIKALSAGLSKQARTRQGKAYENTTLIAIVSTLAKKLKAKVSGTIAPISIPKATQYGETDWAFLVRLCREYGYEIKLADNNQTLVVTKLKDLAAGGTVATLRKSDCSSYTYLDKIAEVPAKSTAKHFDPAKKQLVQSTATGTGGAGQASSDERKRHVQAKTPAQAQAIAQAEQERHELDKTELTLNLPGNPKLVAGAAIKVVEWDALNGEYLISEAKHTLNRSSGYATEIQSKRTKEAA